MLEKGLPFTYKEISLRSKDTGLWFPLKEKPQWFTALNPLGKVCVAMLSFSPVHWLLNNTADMQDGMRHEVIGGSHQIIKP